MTPTPSTASTPAQPSHPAQLRALHQYILLSEAIILHCDTYRDAHSDPDGRPHDEEATGWRMHRRDVETWLAFRQIRPFASHLVAQAEVQIRSLPTSSAGQWADSLRALATALRDIDSLDQEYGVTRDGLPGSVPFESAEYTRYSEYTNEAWHPLNEWTCHGQAVLDINTAYRALLPAAHKHAVSPAPPQAPSAQGSTASR